MGCRLHPKRPAGRSRRRTRASASHDVARLTADAILANRLYVLPHEAARASIRRRFERIDRTFSDQAAEGWSH